MLIILVLYAVFAKSTFQLWSQVLKIKLLHCLILKFILSLKKQNTNLKKTLKNKQTKKQLN